MIRCPRCGADTKVAETRGAKRRRICSSITCNARLTTKEVSADDLALIARLVADNE